MKKLFVCLALAAATARIITPMQWEAETRAEWHQYAAEQRAADPTEADVIREICAADDATLTRSAR